MEENDWMEIKAQKKDEETFLITVAHNGYFIIKEDLNHVFEPFYSTKTALGPQRLDLSIVHALVIELDGEIQVKSNEEMGTQFLITLPFNLRKKEEIDEIIYYEREPV